MSLSPQEEAARARIADALSTRGMRRKVAIELLGNLATPERIKSRQSQLTKWAQGDVVPAADSARNLARAYKKVSGVSIDDDHFVVEQVAPTWAEQMRTIAEAVAPSREEYHQEMQALRKDIESVKQQQARQHRQLMAEIRKLA